MVWALVTQFMVYHTGSTRWNQNTSRKHTYRTSAENSLSWYSCADPASANERDPGFPDGSVHSFNCFWISLRYYDPALVVVWSVCACSLWFFKKKSDVTILWHPKLPPKMSENGRRKMPIRNIRKNGAPRGWGGGVPESSENGTSRNFARDLRENER